MCPDFMDTLCIYIYIYINIYSHICNYGELKPIRIKIQDLPSDTIAQWVEHRRD